MKLSIIICTYNRKKLLGRALECVLNQQTDFPFEIIVGDDGSTDGTDVLLAKYKEKFPDKIVVNTSAENMGLGANWAKAAKSARGKYLAALDDDDLWTDPNRMQIMVDYLESHQDVNLLYTNCYRENEKGHLKIIRYPDNFPDIHQLWLGKQNCISLDVTVVRKSLVDECINLDDYIKYRFPIQDWCTEMLLLPKAKCAYLDMPTCVFSYTPGSLMRPTTYGQIKKKYEREAFIAKYVADCFPDDPLITFSDADSKQYINHLLTTLAYRIGDFKKAKYFSLLSGENALRDKCARIWITFHMFRVAKLLRGMIRD